MLFPSTEAKPRESYEWEAIEVYDQAEREECGTWRGRSAATRLIDLSEYLLAAEERIHSGS